MESKGHLKTYNHLVVVTDDVSACNEAWAVLFGYPAPPIMDTKFYFDQIDYDKYKTLYRGKNWHGDLKQAIIYQNTHLLELKQPGEEDCCREYYEEYGKGIPYFGIVEEANRDPFVERLQREFGCELVHDQKYPGRGDWCLLDTRRQLGCQLCVKEDGFIPDREQPVMDNFSELWLGVEDIERVAENWNKIFELPPINVGTEEIEGTYRGRTEKFVFDVAEIDGPYAFYLVENRGGHLFGDPLASEYGIHAVTVTVSPERAEELLLRARSELGIDVLAEFQFQGQRHRVLDSREKLGVRLIICER